MNLLKTFEKRGAGLYGRRRLSNKGLKNVEKTLLYEK
jgi:hypothetical protein